MYLNSPIFISITDEGLLLFFSLNHQRTFQVPNLSSSKLFNFLSFPLFPINSCYIPNTRQGSQAGWLCQFLACFWHFQHQLLQIYFLQIRSKYYHIYRLTEYIRHMFTTKSPRGNLLIQMQLILASKVHNCLCIPML